MKLLNIIKGIRHQLLIRLYCLYPLKRNKLIMWSNSFRSYGCNPKYLAEYILQNFPNEYAIVWVVDATLPIPKNIPSNIKIVKYFSKQYLKELHTAKFVICNARTSDAYMWHKRKGQVYLQTWHSSLRLKKIEKDAQKYLPISYINSAIKDSKKIDYIISGCEFSSKIFKNSFWYDGKILECGTPRTDFLLKNENRQNSSNKIGLDNDFRYILYSPTFRNIDDFEYKLNFKTIINTCKQHLGGEWKVLYRLHPNLIFKITEYDLGEECINVCSYSDIQELIAVCDLMITDYSSCMFDMMYIKKPCILYMPDYENYVSAERKLYFDIKELPFMKAYTENQVVNCIKNYDSFKYKKGISDFMNKIGSFENGNACEQITKIILKESDKLCINTGKKS